MIRQRGKKKAGVAWLFEKTRREDAAGPTWEKKKKKFKLDKQSLQRTGLKIQVRKKSRAKMKEKDWI